ncbi:hypothetical protein Val02_04670 [Virgisporangium aliadipatigenens]|uniref:SCP2 domain-containing protein n=1 Tax=Virgisporangium aliadipatigenens TaxID=741659 RepID=A0A8J3YGK0_9ACTN|nr:hypothetical protein [Virgisporangium aliadipatigenens]GIJ43581.1 hypothetical protein Val02_04670 [Virgisporangium aliadipatigenens]
MPNTARLIGAGSEPTVTDQEIRSLIDRFVEELHAAGDSGIAGKLRGTPDGDELVWRIALDPAGRSTEAADLTVLASRDTVLRLAGGTESPLEAFRAGRVRLAHPISARTARRLFSR